MRFNINKEMSVKERKEAVQNAQQQLNKVPTINPDIKKILFSILSYAEDKLCGTISSYTTAPIRYSQINTIFRLGVESSQSLEDEKKFYSHVQALLGCIHDKESKLRDTCLPILIRDETKLICDLEQNVPSHRNAVNGIISGTLALGFLSALATREPSYLIISLFVLVGKMKKDSSSPSLLGQLVYRQPTVRQWGNSLNSVIPANISSRLLNLFSKSTNVAINMAEKTVDKLEGIASSPSYGQHRFLAPNPSINVHQNQLSEEENDSYEARQLRQSSL
jgi:hypothetical protein